MPETNEAVVFLNIPLSTWLQITITFLGFPVLIYELLQIAKGLRSSARSSVYDFSARVKAALITYPDLLPFFDNDQEIAKEDPNYGRVMAIADLYAVYLELIATQAEGLSKKNKNAWSRYVLRIYNSSPAIRNHIELRRDEFSTEYCTLVEQTDHRNDTSSRDNQIYNQSPKKLKKDTAVSGTQAHGEELP